jgi:hypothetical protein
MVKVYSPPFFTMLFAINIINILFSTYLITALLIGVTFKILTSAIKNEENIIVILSIITFLVIENTQGLKMFSLTLSSIIIYLFIIPRLKNLVSSSIILDLIYVFILYIFFFIMTNSYVIFDTSLAVILLINFFIDILIIGLIL